MPASKGTGPYLSSVKSGKDKGNGMGWDGMGHDLTCHRWGWTAERLLPAMM